MAREAEREAIIRAAREAGIDPAYALAIAERESKFDPNAKSSSTIRGIFQMNKAARTSTGIGDSTDPYEQSRGWTTHMKAVQREMSGPLGRAPSPAESYLGHHFGGVRAGRMLKMDPNTPVEAVFTAREMRENPHFAKAGTVGNLNNVTVADITKRAAKYGGDGTASPPAVAAGAGAVPAAAAPPFLEPPAPLNAAADAGVQSAAANVASAAAPPAAASSAPPTAAAAGPNSFKGLPNFDTPSIEHLQTARPPMPQIGPIGGMPAAPQMPQQAVPTPDPMAMMLGSVMADQQQHQQQPVDPSLMGIPV